MNLISLVHKLRRLKTYFQFSIFIGALSIFSGLFAGIWFFSSNQKLKNLADIHSNQVRALNRVILTLERGMAYADASDESYFQRRKIFEQIEQEGWLAKQLGESEIQKIKANRYLWDASLQAKILEDLRDKSLKSSEELVSSVQELSVSSQMAISFAVISVVFGLLFPLLVFWLMGKASLKAKAMAQEEFAKTMAQLLENKSDSGPTPFQNPKFYGRAILIVAEKIPLYWNHPLAGVLAELAALINLELKVNLEPKGPGAETATPATNVIFTTSKNK